jgi:predicted nucleotide-binding protein (sugar kinase/HSP70/actin superfamily)
MPRVLNLFSMAPFFRTYFETLGLPQKNLVWSPETSEELWVEGGRYGSIDPCYPSKVIQAHVHELLFHAHPDPKRRRGPLDYIYYPCITHIPFTKEKDFFEENGIEYIDDAITFTEKNLLKKRLFAVWGARLGITEDESDWAVDQGFSALDEYDRIVQAKGRQILDEVEREGRLAILMLGRPYHNDPGLNHGIPDEFQVLGYPILSMRSIPRDPVWMRKYFGNDDPLDINDVWPENYSANSVQKVWAARFASRHPNVALLDISSFKCGNDAPTYGIIDKIVSTARIPFSALHDVDANKPGGSIAIRVKTYAHRLKLVEEELADQAERRASLSRSIADKRQELIAQLRAKRNEPSPVAPAAK